jgi:hypothetical protein
VQSSAPSPRHPCQQRIVSDFAPKSLLKNQRFLNFDCRGLPFRFPVRSKKKDRIDPQIAQMLAD